MSKQIYRSGTSIGANVREAQHAQSDADFLTKMTIAFKEANETSYWLNLLHDNGYLSDDQFTSLDSDNQRILRLLISITKSTKQKIEATKKKITYRASIIGRTEMKHAYKIDPNDEIFLDFKSKFI